MIKFVILDSIKDLGNVFVNYIPYYWFTANDLTSVESFFSGIAGKLSVITRSGSRSNINLLGS